MILRLGCRFDYAPRPGLSEAFTALDKAIADQVNRSDDPRIRAVSQIAMMRFTFPDDLLNCQELYWSDGNHFSAAGEIRFGRRLPDDFLEFR